MRSLRLFLLVAYAILGIHVQTQSCQLVWSDEFTNDISGDWGDNELSITYY